jgi:uncharacterized protein YdeI (YjbR/CyaY-like superfamily)
MKKEIYKGISAIYCKSQVELRQWFITHHETETSVWFIFYKKSSGIPSATYNQAVDEALCFGWIDSKPNQRDEQSYYQYFSRRNPKSKWSAINKKKVELLTREKKIYPEGQRLIDLAKATGTWDALQVVDDMVEPPSLLAAFRKNKTAHQYWISFSPSSKKGILQWIYDAKREETREKRIQETVRLAAQGVKANSYTPRS